MSKRRLTKLTIEQRPPASGRVEVRDTDSPLVFRVTATGARSLCVRTRLGAEQVRLTYSKALTVENLADARLWAQQTVEACKAGIDPRVVQENEKGAAALAAERDELLKFENVVSRYLARRVRKEKNNRTADETARMFSLYVTPRWKDRLITDLRRRDVNLLLDDIFDGRIERGGKTYGGNVAADRVLAQVRALFNWYATKDDEFVTPVVRGMARTNSLERARSRVLSDDELRALWSLLPKHGTFGALVKMLLLTAQRRNEVGLMARSEIDANGVWTIPAERYKTKHPNVVPLPKAALTLIEAQPIIDNSDLIFTLNGKTPFGGFSKAKSRLDAALLAALSATSTERGEDASKFALEDWRLHDIRRTARTLMSRAGVRTDIAERVLGHAILGVKRTYDRHPYINEKRAALEKLSAMVEQIVAPRAIKLADWRRETA